MNEEAMTLRIPATLDSLIRTQQFVRDCAQRCAITGDLRDRLDLVVEELVVNIGSYAYPDSQGDMEVVCHLADGETPPMFCIILRDWGQPFDPLARDNPDLDAELDERRVGGLGIFLVRELATRCAYRRREDMNEFQACFAVEP